MDDNVAVIDKLKELGLDKKTLIMFASDNGAMQEGQRKANATVSIQMVNIAVVKEIFMKVF